MPMLFRNLPLLLWLIWSTSASIFAQTATPSQIPELEQRLQSLENPSEKASLCNELSFAWQKKDPAKAAQYARDAARFANESGNKREAMLSLNLLGDATIRQNDFEQTAKAYQDALTLARQYADKEMEGRALHNKGKLAQRQSNTQQALDLYEKAYQIREQIDDQAGLSSTTQNLGVLYAGISDYEKSTKYYLRALKLKEALGDRAGLATVKTNLGNNYVALGRYKEAEEFFQGAIQINTETGNQSGIAGAQLSLGHIQEKLGHTEAAVRTTESALAIFKNLGDQRNICAANTNIAYFLASSSQYPDAQERFLETLKMAENLPDNSEKTSVLFSIYKGMGRLKGFQKLYKEELEYYNKALAYAQNDYNKTILNESMAAAYTGDRQFETGLQLAREGAQNARKNGYVSLEIGCLYQSANTLLNLNRLPEALKDIDASIALSKKTNDRSTLPAAMVVRSHILNAIDQDHKVALDASKTALAWAQRNGKPLEIAQAWEQLSEAYRALNEADNAVGALRNSQRINDSIFNADNVRKMVAQEKDYEFDKERDVQRLEKEHLASQAAAEMQAQRTLRNQWIMGLSSLLAISLLGFFLWRNRQQVRAQLRVAETRQRIARDLHDEVGSTLSSISILSESARQKDADATRLNNIGDKARAALDSISDIVWSVNPENDTMEKALARMSTYASEMLENQGAELRFKVSPEVEMLSLPMEKRKEFYLIFKEAIHNCAKYAHANYVEVRIEKKNNLLSLLIKDDGVGFDLQRKMPETQVLGGNGLRNMSARATAIGGELHVHTAPGAGTEVRLQLPLI